MAVEYLFPLAIAWERLTLGEACRRGGGDIQTGPFGSQLHAADYVADGIPSVMPQDIADNRIIEDGIARITEADAQRLAKYRMQAGDVVYSRRGDVEKRALVRDREHGWLCGTGCLRIRFGKGVIYPRYAAHYLGHPAVRAWIVRHAHGATMPNLNTSILSEVPFVLPSWSEQVFIGDAIERFDAKIELNRRLNQTLEAMAQAIFKSWFVDFDPVKAKIAAKAEGRDPLRAAMCAISGKTDAELDTLAPDQHAQLAATAVLFPNEMEDSALGEIPKGWSVSSFGAVSTCFDRLRIPLSSREREKRQGTVPYYGATGVMDYVDEAIFDDVYLLLGEDGSVLKPDGTPFVQYIWGKSWVNNHAHVLQGTNGVSTEQLMLFISTQNISAFVTGAVQLKLNQKNMNSIPFMKAPLETNKSFGELISPFFAKHRTRVEEIRTLTELRDSLLPRLLSGELKVHSTAPEVAV